MSGNVLFSYIGIDIFGSKFCSNLRCSSQENEKCLEMMNMTYKVMVIDILYENQNPMQYSTWDGKV